MRTRSFLIATALGALLVVPAGAAAQSPADAAASAVSPAAGFTATISMRANTRTLKTPVKVGATSVPSGKRVLGWFLSENPAANPTGATPGWKAAPSAFVMAAGEGTHTIYVWARVKGAISQRGSVTTTLDQTLPTASLTINTANPAAARTISVTATADPGTGTPIARYAIVEGTTAPTLGSAWTTAAPTTFKLSAGNGAKTVSLFAKDAAGNISAASTKSITLTIPTPTVVIDLKKAYSNSLTVPVGVTKTDPSNTGLMYWLSTSSATPAVGATGWKLVPTNYKFAAGDGTKTLYGWVKDGNNTLSAVSSDTVVIDQTAPTATLTVTGGPTLSLAGSDGGSGLDGWVLVTGTVAPDVNDDVWSATSADALAAYSIPTGTNTVTLFVKDRAGNVSAVNASSSKSVTK